MNILCKVSFIIQDENQFMVWVYVFCVLYVDYFLFKLMFNDLFFYVIYIFIE